MTSHHRLTWKQDSIASLTNEIFSITMFIDALKAHQKAFKAVKKNEAENLVEKLLGRRH